MASGTDRNKHLALVKVFVFLEQVVTFGSRRDSPDILKCM